MYVTTAKHTAPGTLPTVPSEHAAWGRRRADVVARGPGFTQPQTRRTMGTRCTDSDPSREGAWRGKGCCLCPSSHGSVDSHSTGARKNQGKHRSPPTPTRGMSVLPAGHHPIQTAACQQGPLSQEARAKVSARRPHAEAEPGWQPPSGEEFCAEGAPETTEARLGPRVHSNSCASSR